MYHGGLCFITDRKTSLLSIEDMTLKVLKAGVKWIQYREKERSMRKMFEETTKLKRLSKDYNALFIVNDYVDLALCVDADGVHLGQEDLHLTEARRILGKGKIIGISTHTLVQAIEAEKGGADYIGFGPIFFTATKDAGSPKGIDILQEVKKQVRIPVVAIGGINLENVRPVFDTDVDAIAVASAILKGDVEENAKRFMGIIAGLK